MSTYISIVESVRSIFRLRYTFSWYHRSTNCNFDCKYTGRSLWTWSCCLPEQPYHFQCRSAVHNLRLYMWKIIKYFRWYYTILYYCIYLIYRLKRNHRSILKQILTFTHWCRTGPKSIGATCSLGWSLHIMSFRANIFDHRRYFEWVWAYDRTIYLDVGTSTRRRHYMNTRENRTIVIVDLVCWKRLTSILWVILTVLTDPMQII